MKNVLFGVLVVILLIGAAYAQDSVKPTLITIEGKIVLEKNAEGKDVASIKAGLVDMLLIDCPKLQELLQIEKVSEKIFVLRGEKVTNAEGETEGFKLHSFKEAAPPAFDAHQGHGHGSHGGHGHDH